MEKSVIFLNFYACQLEIRLKFTDRMQGHLHTSSGIERFVWLICFFAVYKQQTSPQLHCWVDEPQQKPADGHQK